MVSKFLTLEGSQDTRKASLMENIVNGLGFTTYEENKVNKDAAYVKAKDYGDIMKAWEKKFTACNDDSCRTDVTRRRLDPYVKTGDDAYGDPIFERGDNPETWRKINKEKEAEKSTEKHLTYMMTPTSESASKGNAPSEKGPSLFASYDMGQDLATDLEGFGSWFKRAVSPPRRIRKAIGKHFSVKRFKRLITPGRQFKKGLRYAGAAYFTVMTGGFASGRANKMFGLSGSEQKVFNVAAKIARVTAVAVVTVATAGALLPASGGAGAGAGATAKLGASLGSKGMSFGARSVFTKFLAKTAVKQALMKGAKFIMKDTKGKSLWSFAGTAAGGLISSKFSKRSVTPDEFASLPENQPVPVPSPSDGGGGGAPSGGGFSNDAQSGIPDNPIPATKAGSGGDDTNSPEEASIVNGEEDTVTPAEREANAVVNPLGHDAKVTQFDDNDIQNAPAASANVSSILEDQSEAEATDAPLSCEFDRALACVRSRQANRIKASNGLGAAGKGGLWGKLSC